MSLCGTVAIAGSGGCAVAVVAILQVSWLPPMLPLAISASLLMLLSSLSFQALALQQHAQLQLQWRQRQLEDALQSAAQQLAGELQRQHSCLLPLPLALWPSAVCSTPVLPDGVVLLAYQPSPGGAQMLLRREAGGSAAAFALHWQPAPAGATPQLQRLQFLGLRGL
jgi:hypothetical protein